MDKRICFVLIALAGAGPARSQHVSLGLIGGAGLTGAVHDRTTGDAPFVTRTWSPTRDWIAGAALEFHFRPALSLEVDGMYRKLHMTWAAVMADGSLNSVSPSPVVTWEFPVLAKYRFPIGGWQPFVEAGPSFRTTGNLNFEPSRFGAAAGLGMEARWRGLNLTPVLRYTRWAADQDRYGRPSISQLNQLEVLVAFSRPADSAWRPAGRRLSVGAVLGWGLTPDLPGSQSGITSSVTGPAVEIHLRPRWSVEVNALHKPLRTRYTVISENGSASRTYTATSATTWQFPLLAKYRLRRGRVQPFAEAGPSFRLPQWDLATRGATAGAGVEWRVRALKLSPALRFTHWARDTGMAPSGVARNEASVLVGLSLGGYAGR